MKRKLIHIALASCLVSTTFPSVSFAEELLKHTSTAQSDTHTQTSDSTTEETTQTTDTETNGGNTEETTEETKNSSQSSQTEESAITTTTSSDEPLRPAISDVHYDQTYPEIEPTITSSSAIHFDKNVTTEEFVVRIGESARKIGQETDLFASVMIAQAILESGSGSSELAQAPNNNLFGIKGDYKGKSVVYSTWEDDGHGNSYATDAAFRTYPSVKESFEDYSKLLKEGLENNPTFYQDTWKSLAETYQNATAALKGTYATDTQYNEKLDALIETYNLTQYDHEKADFVSSDSDFEPYNQVNYDTQNMYAWGNCTQYVYNRITQLGGSMELTMGNGKDWGTSGHARGYEVTNTPKAGTAVSFNAGVLGADATYGHVAFVEKVYKDGSILISEMNALGLNVVSTRTIPTEYTGLLTYISPK